VRRISPARIDRAWFRGSRRERCDRRTEASQMGTTATLPR
jgi:hypothetical protein